MEFKELFNPLKKCLGDGHNRQYFFRDLMAMITTVTEDEFGTVLDPNTKRINENTIFNFIKRGLSQTFAQSIVNRLTPENLTEQINSRPDGTREALAKELSIYDKEINAENVGVKAADMMVKIITMSAGLMSDEEMAAENEAIKARKNTKKSKESSETDSPEMKETDVLMARSFLVSHENEKNLIPLCQIAMIHSPEHKHVRAMYTEFILLPKVVQNYILKASNAESLINLDSLHYGEAIDLLCKDLEEYKLSSPRYLYMFGQYLHCAFDYYSECDISKYDNCSFTRLCKSSLIFLHDVGSPIDAYIDDYLWMKDNKKQTDAPPPMDYLWHEKNFGACQEEDLTYWLCRFVIDVCNNLYHRVKKADLDLLYVEDQYAETQEDMYYCALNALYNLYLCHTRVAFNDGVEIKQSL